MPEPIDFESESISSECFDEMVHDAASELAAAINNEGKKAQLEFLRVRGWSDENIRLGLDVPEPA